MTPESPLDQVPLVTDLRPKLRSQEDEPSSCPAAAAVTPKINDKEANKPHRTDLACFMDTLLRLKAWLLATFPTRRRGLSKGARRELQFQASQLLRFLAKWLLVRVSSSPGCVYRWGHQAELRISEKAHATICHRSCSEAPSRFLVQARAMRGISSLPSLER